MLSIYQVFFNPLLFFSFLKVDVLFVQHIKMLKIIVSDTDNTNSDEIVPLLTYVCQSSDGKVTPLIPDGHNIQLRRKDCAMYIERALNYRLNETSVPMKYIREGLVLVIPLSIVSLLTGSKLERLVCGSCDIDVMSLKKIVRFVKL